MYSGAATAAIPMAMPSRKRATISNITVSMTAAISAPTANKDAAAIRTERRPNRSVIGPATLAATSAPSGTAAVMKPPTSGLIGRSFSSEARATAITPSS